MRDLRRLGGFLILSLIALNTSLLRADEEQVCPATITYTSYDVSGDTAEVLQEQLRTKGPRDREGKIRFAYTQWNVKWRWHNFRDGSVDATSVQLMCSATIQLPRLVDEDKVSPQVRKLWNAFLEKTKRHELNHVAHLEQGAPKIIELIHKSADERGVISNKEASAIAKRVSAEIRLKDREYDARTKHGKTEGTWYIDPEASKARG
jgi:predicted secreted Zn-dependent protease